MEQEYFDIPAEFEKLFGSPMDDETDERIDMARDAGMTDRIIMAAMCSVRNRMDHGPLPKTPAAEVIGTLRRLWKIGVR